MADDNTIIEGTVKFRDGRKWKSRWCVMRRLSPVADCVQLQLYRDARARCAGGSEAALALQHFLGCEAGFTLDRHSHTLALVCGDLVAVLAFETRERLLQWQVKLGAALGEARCHLVLLAAARRLPRGPARLHVRGASLALTRGTPPRLLAVWQLAHLRRYGVVEGRFCFEGGSLCGRGEGLHVLVSDRVGEIARDVELAARGGPAPPRPRTLRRDDDGATSAESRASFRPDTRLSELGPAGAGGWAAAERDRGDSASLHGATDEAPAVALERCMSCMSKLGALSRSSTAALTPGARHFSPAWTMEALCEAPAAAEERVACRCAAPSALPPPQRPPKPARLQLPPGPYDNYDVPKVPSAEVEGEYYDTPRRLRERLEDELFEMTRSSTPDALVLRKRCGCLLRVGRRRAPSVRDAEDSRPPGAACACARVAAWAEALLSRPPAAAPVATPAATPAEAERAALYATVDVARKAARRAAREPPPEADDGPLAHYENLSFALSLEHYENARELLRRAGVTRAELDAIAANLRGPGRACARCAAAEYLPMGPAAPLAGYTPMSPIGGFAFRTPRPPARSPLAGGPLDEKSASNPALSVPAPARSPAVAPAADVAELRRRSSSADSARFLDGDRPAADADAADGSRSSLETLRDAGDGAGPPGECGCTDRAAADAPPGAGGVAGNRDSSSSNDSGVSSCSLRRAGDRRFELPRTTAEARRHYRSARRRSPPAAPSPRRARSSDAPRRPAAPAGKCASAEAEVPLLAARPPRAVADTPSTSSGASDMSDYVETLSLCSSHSSTDTPVTQRAARAGIATATLRPRSGKEYHNVDARLTGALRGPEGPAAAFRVGVHRRLECE